MVITADGCTAAVAGNAITLTPSATLGADGVGTDPKRFQATTIVFNSTAAPPAEWSVAGRKFKVTIEAMS